MPHFPPLSPKFGRIALDFYSACWSVWKFVMVRISAEILRLASSANEWMCASISGPFKYEKVVLRFIGFNSMEPLAASAFNLPKIQKVKITPFLHSWPQIFCNRPTSGPTRESTISGAEFLGQLIFHSFERSSRKHRRQTTFSPLPRTQVPRSYTPNPRRSQNVDTSWAQKNLQISPRSIPWSTPGPFGLITLTGELKGNSSPKFVHTTVHKAWVTTTYFRRQKQATWGQTLRSVYTFNTVEDFWCLYNNILTPSRLIMGTDFHLFKEGIEPKWEDAKCAKGGKWTYFFPKSKEPGSLDDCWLNLLLAMIGEQFCEPSEICGAVVSVRQKQHRVALWTKTASDEVDQMAIGRHFKTVLGLAENEKIGYMVHDDAIRLERRAKDRYTVWVWKHWLFGRLPASCVSLEIPRTF